MGPYINRATRLKLKRGSRPKLKRSTRPKLGARSECDDFLLEQYRNTVNENDVVIFLGDLTFKKNHKGQKMTEIFTKLPGRKVLIKGNHDWYKDSFYRKCGFLSVNRYLIFGNYFLCHFPVTGKPDYHGRLMDEEYCKFVKATRGFIGEKQVAVQ